MSEREIQDLKSMANEILVQQAVHASAEILADTSRLNAVSTFKGEQDCMIEPPAGSSSFEPADLSTVSVRRRDVTQLIELVRQLEAIAKRQCSRIAVKSNGKIIFLAVDEIVAVEAEGNYVLLRHRPSTYLLRESISSMAEKLKPYGFVRIHRSVVVNISAVEQIQPLPTGEYRLHVKGGREYLVTRTYKDNLKDLAQLWVGSQHFCG